MTSPRLKLIPRLLGKIIGRRRCRNRHATRPNRNVVVEDANALLGSVHVPATVVGAAKVAYALITNIMTIA
jgi:hypothetical protein